LEITDWSLPTVHAVSTAARILRQRQARHGGGHDGDLTALQPTFSRQFGRDHVWSISRLETYRSCRFYFFISHVLGVEPRRDPVEGLNARQLGSLYHRLFEAVYRPPLPPPGAGEPAVHAHVMSRAKPILDDAPRDEGFRVTAWWAQTREEIVANVTRSVIALADPALAAGFSPWLFEMWFSEDDLLRIDHRDDGDDDGIQLRGIIDRVDRNEAGEVRVIDYKLAGPASFREQDLIAGRTLQLPLYALAVETALQLGPVADGFYWHFQQGEPSKLTLKTFGGGPRAAMDTASAHAWSAVRGARAGEFRPAPPPAGCPDHCPAAAFCYHYHPRRTAG
jgi:ATP-dependent helicase/DNAse subunit B